MLSAELCSQSIVTTVYEWSDRKQWWTSLSCLSFLLLCILHCPISLHFAKCKFKNKIKNLKKATRALNQAETLKSTKLCGKAQIKHYEASLDWLCILFLLRENVKLCCVLSPHQTYLVCHCNIHNLNIMLRVSLRKACGYTGILFLNRRLYNKIQA